MVKAECIDWVQVDGFRVWWKLRCKIYIRGEAAPHKFESRDAWLGIGDL